MTLNSELYPFQQRAVDDIRQSIRGGVRSLVVQAATGAGKTKIAAALVDRAMTKGNRMAFVVPSISLIDQTVESFYAEGIRGMGVIQANHEMTDWSQPVQICSIQTIEARKEFPEAKAVVFDECHRLHEAHKRWITNEDWQKIPFLGLSATPWTRGLGKYFESILIAATTADLIEQGYLSKFRVFATGHPDLSGVRTVAGDYHEGELSNVMQGGELTADIIKTWKEKWGQGKTLCFGVDKAHAKSIQERFEFAGISCGYQDAETTAIERREIKRKFHNGDYQIVSNIQTLCLDEQTEILTSSGWVGIDDMNSTHLIAAWAETGIEFTPPKTIVRRNREPHEKMVSLEGRNQNVRVTSNHRMLWSETKGNFGIKPAGDIVGLSGYIPVSGYAPPRSFSFPKPVAEVDRKRHNGLTYKYRKQGMDSATADELALAHRTHVNDTCAPKLPSALTIDECSFIGFWLGDGTKSCGRYSAAQSKRYPEIICWFDSLLERIGLHFTRSVYPPAANSTFESIRWNFSTGRGGRDQRVVGGLASIIPYLEKDGTDLLWGFDAEQFRALLNGFWMADGNHGDGITKKEYGWRIFGRSKKLFDILQAVGECRGFRVSIANELGAHRKTPFYRLSWFERTAMQLVRERFVLENDFKAERVWCVTSTTGNLVTRRKGKVAVVGNTTGVDWDVRCLILARPTRSEMLYVQIIGRALRTAEGKVDALILDHSDTTAKLGFVTDIVHENLDDGKPKKKAAAAEKKEPLPKECEKCAYLKPQRTKVCPNCGHENKIISGIVERDGELMELTRGVFTKQKRGDARKYTMTEKSEFLAGLKSIGKEKGYQPGWALNQYRTKFGAWPDHSIANVIAHWPTMEVRMYVKSRQIAWAKSKRRAEMNNAGTSNGK